VRKSGFTQAASQPWPIVVVTVAAGSTYFVRSLLALISLQGLTFLLPILVAAYFYGWVLAGLASALSLLVAHLILWVENPQVLFTRGYFVGVGQYLLFSSLIVSYTYRHERVLTRLDEALKREKAARREAEEASRLKDHFLATLSHELRTPSNVILGYLDMLRTNRTDNPQKALEILTRNAQQQSRLIEDVLDVARISTGTLQINQEPQLCSALLRDAIEALQPAMAAKQLHLELKDDRPGICILGDADRLRQVFWNILSNAVKFTPAGGRIDVSIHPVGDQLEVRIHDTGRGIAATFLPHVFEMFRQADPSSTREVSGMGLGLNLVKRLVELHGGEVTAASAGESRGATFTCRFPVYRGAASGRSTLASRVAATEV
jgi:signal transduction histidine kinase